MTSRSRFFAVIVSILVGVAIFTTLYSLTKPAAPRVPSSDYQTLAEEYINAIETFNHTGEVVIPEGAIFSYDGNTVVIKDHDSGAYVTCDFVLNGTVPIYNYTYYVSILPAFFATFFGILFALFCYFSINAYGEGKKYRALNKIKSNAVYGDDRRFSSNCSKCHKKMRCKCIQCPYAKECGQCPSTDCMDTFEDMLLEHITPEDMSQYEFDDIDQEKTQFEDVSQEVVSKEDETANTNKCDDCEKRTSCKCEDCYYVWVCEECPSENCVEETKAKIQQSCGDASVHTLDESETAFQCTPDCSNFNKCECLHGCDYVSECHKCPYPGCTHDIEMKLLGMNIPK